MAYIATIKIGQLEIKDIISFDYRLYNTHASHSEGKAAGRIEGGEFSFIVNSSSKTDIYQWLVTGKIITGEIKVGDAEKKGADLRTIKFDKALITSYSESFSRDIPMTLQFSFIADKLDINGFKWDFVQQK